MPFRSFRYIYEVMNCRSINQAAQHLFISPQALRSAIGNLEDHLGFKIFERSKRGITLTPEGERIQEDVAAIVQIGRRWSEIGGGPKNSVVRLVASTSVCNTVIPALILECHEKYPNLTLQQFEARDDSLLNMLTKTRMIGVVGAAPREDAVGMYKEFAKNNDYQLEFLREDQFYVFINCGNPLAEKSALSLSDLASLTPAIYPGEDKRVSWKKIFQYFRPSPLFIMHQENIFQIVSEDPKIACIFPAVAADNDRFVLSGKVCPMTVTDFPMPALASLIYPQPKELTLGEKVVLDMIRTRMKDASMRSLDRELSEHFSH